MTYDEPYNVFILENSQCPVDLENKDRIYIRRFSTLYPLGLNKVNPFGPPLLSIFKSYLTINGNHSIDSSILLLFIFS